jgi:hypothetical protein
MSQVSIPHGRGFRSDAQAGRRRRAQSYGRPAARPSPLLHSAGKPQRGLSGATANGRLRQLIELNRMTATGTKPTAVEGCNVRKSDISGDRPNAAEADGAASRPQYLTPANGRSQARRFGRPEPHAAPNSGRVRSCGPSASSAERATHRLGHSCTKNSLEPMPQKSGAPRTNRKSQLVATC